MPSPSPLPTKTVLTRPLTAQDICKGMFTDTQGRHCSMGWRRALGVTNEVFIKHMRSHIGEGRSIIGWNDYPRTSKAKIADTLNKVFRKLGLLDPAPRSSRPRKKR